MTELRVIRENTIQPEALQGLAELLAAEAVRRGLVQSNGADGQCDNGAEDAEAVERTE